MSIDMSQFLQTFYEESFEGLGIMEAELLNLDVGAADAETINTIFRAAHSIKGGSGTFGLTAVAEFTHIMETLLDEMRDGRRQVTQEAVNILLSSVDVLREMLIALRDDHDLDVDSIASAQQELSALLAGGKEGGQSAAAGATNASGQTGAGAWDITFKPHLHLFQSGNDPVRMLRELNELGDMQVVVDTTQLPEADAFVPENSYLSWQIRLNGDINEAQIREIFEWVEDECDLEIRPVANEHAATVADEGTKAAVTEAALPDERRRGVDRRKGGGAGVETASIRVSIDKVDELINTVGELVITQSMLSQFADAEELTMAHIEKLRSGLAQLERNTRELQESVMRIRMLPISFAFQRFPRLVHDLSSKLGKKIELKLSGEQTELDKTVMEKIGDPLVHLVRNSIDHGIEKPDARRAAGKAEVGLVHLNAYHQGGNIVIEIKDDGAGLNREKIQAKARQRELIGADEVLTDEQIFDLIFQPGFSTAEQVSDVSGRGVGMDVVRKNIRSLGGSVEVKSRQGEGSTFTIRLPLTLAILDGQLIQIGHETYIIPLVSIVESIQVKTDRVNVVAGRGEIYQLRNEYIPIVRLYHVFGVKPKVTNLKEGLLVVVEADGQKLALFVDELHGQQQVVIKSLESNFRKVEGLSGATILGDGTVALILDISGLASLHRKQVPVPDLKVINSGTAAA
ncbi:MAG: chemotaxis protein CheA [Gammaproteobacteria bacterium]|nr:chemotaxis protein CheA [Gammaproteobacteria bacterium]